MKNWIIHCDLNKFYASIICARYPWMANDPIIVMSNNDGNNICFRPGRLSIDTGIVMGTPIFEIKNLINRLNIQLFSCNFPLIADISLRVKGILKRYVDEIEDYSIDEVFGKISGVPLCQVQEMCREIRRAILQGLHLPISIGISTSKTLAKVATRFAKKYKGYEGVCTIYTEEQRVKALKLTDIGDIWGIGREYARKLRRYHVKTAYDFSQLPYNLVKKQMTIVGARTLLELDGIPCLELEQVAPKKKNLIVSRGYGKMISDVKYIVEATVNYLCMGTEKLRKQGSCAKSISVFIETNPFREDLEQDYTTIRIPLMVASNSDMELIPFIRKSVEAAVKPGLLYKKSGIFFNDLVDENALQTSLWDCRNRKKERKVLEVKDYINLKYGRNTLQLAKQGNAREWKIKQEKLPPYWTTRMSDFPKVEDIPIQQEMTEDMEFWGIADGDGFKIIIVKKQSNSNNNANFIQKNKMARQSQNA